ncbi:MAG TPA: TetR/AcrR family transcriptional regulator [Alphaproteobacteria bacterium]|nr:TetR/AcrR family transcriptional regulator [Alphaproteobacteria bacterium]
MKLRAAKHKPRAYNLGARADAAEALGQRIVDAFLARLMKHWFDEITLDQIAADAETTVQTIVRRFGGKDGLLAVAVKTFARGVNASRVTPVGDIPRMVDNLVADYEQSGDAVIRLLALESRHPAVKAATDLGRSEHRSWVTGILAESLEKLDAGARKQAFDVLVIATDVYTWKLLRRDMGYSAAATKSAIKKLVHAAIIEFSETKPSRRSE